MTGEHKSAPAPLSEDQRVELPKEPISRGICYKHLWGAPLGRDTLECPYCNGTKRSRL